MSIENYDSQDKSLHTMAPYNCEFCNKRFVRYMLLRAHQKTHEPLLPSIKNEPDDEETPPDCPKTCLMPDVSEATKDFEDSQDLALEIDAGLLYEVVLKGQLKTLSQSTKYRCEECSKCFNGNYKLRRHMLSHSKVKPFQCEECQQRFSQRGHLKEHMRKHTGSRPFECTECGSSFTRSGNLKTHMRIHTGEKVYNCEYCAKPFSRYNGLQKHLTVHTGAKPYSCSYCGKCFSQLGHMRTHERRHTGVKPYRCHICEKTFADGSDYRRHTKIHDKGNRDGVESSLIDPDEVGLTTMVVPTLSSGISAIEEIQEKDCEIEIKQESDEDETLIFQNSHVDEECATLIIKQEELV